MYFFGCLRDAPPEARRIHKKLDIHYTPKHGSWLDMAEIELNVMTRQCLSRRIADIETLKSELSAWESDRNTADSKIVWQFQTKDARVKLASLNRRSLNVNFYMSSRRYTRFSFKKAGCCG